MTVFTRDIPDEFRNVLRTEIQKQIIECLNRFYAMETGMWGKPVDCLIVRTVIQGRLQGKPYDLSALAATLGLPVGTVHRKVSDLVEAGYLDREPSGKSVYLAPTDATCVKLDESFETMVSTLRRLYKSGAIEDAQVQPQRL
ncbi:helix-turn-helix domain-containing protein [Sedimentitalea nanhaiensis]|uniref:IclR helix-turn-helix domain-containing protein n=1 Tax=Sedimentitalea nanhaiensis TaxID=999627 RepID=A0A1I7D5T1_9RHOB|nr:helix-turn-helix domain-containing protein [Sedimentitalea nanhaiensis]SFU07025.1 IclR helix-turn-helix domain-containing protein [Sedimentitalea nanhaiensis]